MFHAPGKNQTRAASSLGTMQNIRRPGHAKSRPQVHRSYTPGQPQARIRHGRPCATRSGTHATAAPPAEQHPRAMPPRFPHRGRRDHTTPAAQDRPCPRIPGNPFIRPGATPGSRSVRPPPGYPPGTPGNRGTRVPERAPGSAPHAKPEWAHRGPCPWPSVEKPTVRTDRPGGPDAVRYTSVDTATYRPAVTHGDTWCDKKKTAPRVRFRSQGAVSAGSGRCWVRTNVG